MHLLKTMVALLLTCSCCGAVLAGEASLTARHSGVLESALVMAQVASRSRTDLGTRLEFKISHVYSGGEALLGKTFFAEVRQLGGHGVLVLDPLPEIGEVGLWQVTASGDELVADVMAMQKKAGIVELPARKLQSPPGVAYRRALQWAEAVERVARTPAGGRPAALKDLAASQDPAVSAWAIHVLADLGPEEHAEFLEHLASVDLPTQGEIALDEVLSRLLGKRWQESPARHRMLRGWVSGSLEEVDIGKVATRLDVAFGRGELDAALLLELAQSALSNAELPATGRQSFLRFVGLAANRQDVGAKAFDLLARLVGGGTDDELQVAAARTIKSYVKLSGERSRVLQAILEQTGNKEAASVLREALKTPS